MQRNRPTVTGTSAAAGRGLPRLREASLAVAIVTAASPSTLEALSGGSWTGSAVLAMCGLPLYLFVRATLSAARRELRPTV